MPQKSVWHCCAAVHDRLHVPALSPCRPVFSNMWHVMYDGWCCVQGECTVPARLEEELATNPFLRPQDPDIRKTLGTSVALLVVSFLCSGQLQCSLIGLRCFGSLHAF